MKILGIVGSLRRDSYNLQLAKNIEKIGRELDPSTEFTYANVNLPLFNEDYAENPPADVTALKDAITAADLVLVLSPEYNRSFSGVIKNALDWTVYWKDNRWAGKKAVLAGASTSQLGTGLAQYALRQFLAFSGATLLSRPELEIGTAHEKFDENGVYADQDELRHFFEAVLDFAR